MADEAQDVMAEGTATESSPEANQSEEVPSASEGEKTQDTPQSDGGEGRTVPYSRFKEVVADRNEKQKLLESLETQPQTFQEQPAQEQSGSEQPSTQSQQQARDQLKGLFREAYEEMTRPQQQLADARKKYLDFDEMLPFVNDILDARKDIKSTSNPVETAYIMAKGLIASHDIDKARQAGKQEAYKSIDQKVASRPGAPVPKKDAGGKSDLLQKFQSGKLSSDQIKANWSKLQAEMAQVNA